MSSSKPRARTTTEAQQANEKLMESIASITEVRVPHARLSPSGRFWGASQFKNRLCKSALENGITSLPRYPPNRGKLKVATCLGRKLSPARKGEDTAFFAIVIRTRFKR
jgi:hypothetical protein